MSFGQLARSFQLLSHQQIERWSRSSPPRYMYRLWIGSTSRLSDTDNCSRQPGPLLDSTYTFAI